MKREHLARRVIRDLDKLASWKKGFTYFIEDGRLEFSGGYPFDNILARAMKYQREIVLILSSGARVPNTLREMIEQ